MTRGGLSGPVTVVAVTCEFWMHGFPVPGQTQRLAVRAGELGFDGLLLAAGGLSGHDGRMVAAAGSEYDRSRHDQTNVALARDVLPVVRRGTES